jgi:hypothetical protein
MNFKERSVSLETTFNNQFEGNDEMHYVNNKSERKISDLT